MNMQRSGKKGKQTIGRTPVEGFCLTSRFHGQKQQQQRRVAQSEARNQCIILAGATTKTKDTFWARFVPAKTKRPQRFGLTCVGLIHIMQGPCQFFWLPRGCNDNVDDNDDNNNSMRGENDKKKKLAARNVCPNQIYKFGRPLFLFWDHPLLNVWMLLHSNGLHISNLFFFFSFFSLNNSKLPKVPLVDTAGGLR